MSEELCEMSLQQTQELLRLIDTVLQNICCRRFSGEDLYVEALQRVLGGAGRRGPAKIFMVFQEQDGTIRSGRVFHLRQGSVEGSEEVTIDPTSSYALSLSLTEVQNDVIVANWANGSESVKAYQQVFPPEVMALVEGGVRNFVCYHISGETPGVVAAFNYPGRATDYDATVLRSLAVVIGSLVTLSDEVRETEMAFIYTIEALARACEAAEEQTGLHIVRVNRYAGALAAHLELTPEFVDVISYSAQMHDVGKIKIPQAILLKEGPLNDEETALMKLHPVYGEKILGDSPRLQVAREIAIAHHENWDGSGYPYGLKGDDIPLAGRIVKLADVYDALRSRRSYKAPLSHDEALRVLREGDERIVPRDHFDPVILATFLRIEQMFARIYDSLAGEGA